MSKRRTLGRRDVLRLGAGAAVALPLAWGCGPGEQPFDEGVCEPTADGARALELNPIAISENDDLFSLGVAAGEPSSTGAVFSTFAGDGQPKTLRVWREEGGARLLAHESQVTPVDGYLKAAVSGLAAQTSYRYAFFDADDASRSAIGTVTTAFGAGCRRAVTVAATTCTSARFAPYEALEVMAKHDFDLLCHLGDMSYNDGAVTLEQYREKWRATMRDPGYRALLPKAGMLITWDDHEFDNNVDAQTFDPDRLEAAKQAFYETLPVVRQDEDRLWRSHRWGDTVEFFLLDSRLERKRETAPTDDAIYLSKEQFAWLKKGLTASTAHFKVVLNSVPITDMPAFWVGEGDRWEGYASQRAELVSLVAELSNVWFISGDFHVGAVTRVEREGPARKVWEILAGPGANINPLTWAYEHGSEEERENIAGADQFKYFSGAFAATLLTFDAEKDAVRIQFIGTDDNTLFDQWVSQRD